MKINQIVAQKLIERLKAAQLIVSEFERNLEELKQQSVDEQEIDTDTTKLIDGKENQDAIQTEL